MQVVKYLMTKPAPPACAQAVANYPTAYTTFSTTDPEAYLWFYVTGANTGDVFATQYYTPSGQFYSAVSGAFDPLTSGGNWCFVDWPFQIAGYPPANLPGVWTVKATYNGTVVFTLQFTITAGSTCTYTLSPATASYTSTGGSGSATVTTQTGCSWSASSSVAWLTTTSTGSGNGTVNYTVAANTSTSTRSGTVTVGGQTLTVTQSGQASTMPVYYRFENGISGAAATGTSSIVDSGGLGLHGTGSGSLTYSSDVPVSPLPLNLTSNALSLSIGSTGVVQFSNSFPLNTASAATMEFYIKPAASTSENDFLWTSLSSADANRFNMGVTNSGSGRAIFLDYRDVNGYLHSLLTIPVASTAWTHVAVVKSGNTWTGYANGVQQGQFYTDSSPNLPTNTGWTFNGRGMNSFTGLLDEFRITLSALTPAQFLGPPSTTSSGLNLSINQVIDTACPSDKVIVSVTDSTGKAVTGLTASNFTLKEAGNLRTITVTPVGSGSTTGALSLAILIDTSGSLSGTDLANEKSAAKQLVAQLGSADQVAVYAFETTVHLQQDFTADKTKVNAAIDAITAGSTTALYKAIQTAAQALAARTGRKSIVLMTDGEDNEGGVTLDQAIAAAKSAGAPIFPVGFGSANATILGQIATQTGGFYTASSSSSSLQSILSSLGQVISSQYEISYTSQLTSTDNQVDITVTHNGQTATASRTVSKCSGTSTGLTLNINQVIDTACPADKLIVSVTDSTGKAVTGLTASNFTLKEAGSVRTITVTSAGSGSATGALSLAILIDTSSSLSSTDLANEKAAAKQLVSQLGSSDQVAIYAFETTVHLQQDFTSDKTKLNTAIDAVTAGSSTALYQAIQIASQALGARSGRKSIVLMTDGEDTMYNVDITTAINAAKTAGVPVFPVGFGSANSTILTQIATQTGGFYTASSGSAGLQNILTSLGQVISSQYEISYTSLLTTTDNQVDITVTYNGQTATASRTVSKCSSSSSCTYFLQPQSLSIPVAGATGSIIVSTQLGCAVTASSSVSWIHIIGSSSGAVSYQVDANTSGQRTGTITIGNRTVAVTQDGVVSCTYSLTPPTNSAGSLGASSSVRLTTQAGCAWTVTLAGAGSWFHLTSPTSGSGMATITYTVDANTSTSTRSAILTVAGLAFTLTQSGGASQTGPTIADGGIVNAASNRAGVIARGSFFTIYGSNLGPPPYQQAQGYPIPDTMGGVIVTVSQGSYNKRAFLQFVSPPQINAILPSDTPLGTVQITVTYNGNISTTATMTVVDTNFGSFSIASGPGPGIVQNYNSATDQPLNLQSYPLKPGQIAILWGTGLGPVPADNVTPPIGNLPIPVEVRVGGKVATLLYYGRAPTFAGVDNIYFNVPNDAPTGCSVPVQINAGGVVSNTVRIAISTDGKKCQDTSNPFGNTVVTGAKHGEIGLVRVALSGTTDSSKGPVNSSFDVGIGLFTNTPAGGDLGFSPFLSLMPVGTCSSTNKSLDGGSVISSGGLSLGGSNTTQLDAGTELAVKGPNGTQKLVHFDPNAASGPYLSLIGGTAPIDGSQTMAMFLDPGSYTVTGTGGKDVGQFTASLTLPTPITWTNASAITSLTRSSGVTVNWTGGDATQSVVIIGGATDQKTKKSGGFVCLAPVAAGTFTVPASVLADLPATGSTIGPSDSLGMIGVASVPLGTPQSFTAPGLDAGRIFYTILTARAVPVQ